MIQTSAVSIAMQQIEQQYEWIDDAFRVEKARFMWKSIRKDTGKDFIFGISEENVTHMTRL